MVPVQVDGVRRNFRQSSVFMYTVNLVEEGGRHIFNLGIERHEALPIVADLHHLHVPRPPTLQLLVDTLALHGITFTAIQLNDLHPSPVYLVAATLHWRDAGGATGSCGGSCAPVMRSVSPCRRATASCWRMIWRSGWGHPDGGANRRDLPARRPATTRGART